MEDKNLEKDDNFERAAVCSEVNSKSGITNAQKTAIRVWSVITGTIWIGWIVARFTVGGNCERPTLDQNFQKQDYLGRWYEMYRENSVPFESEDCATATYVDLPGNYIQVNNIEYAISR